MGMCVRPAAAGDRKENKPLELFLHKAKDLSSTSSLVLNVLADNRSGESFAYLVV